MIKEEFAKAATELSVIFSNMPIEMLDKIPDGFKKFISEIKSTSYIFEYNNKLKLDEQILLPETHGLLALVYVIYLCDEDQKKEFYEAYSKYQRSLNK